MFQLSSYKANGDRLEHAGQTPAFFGLWRSKEFLGYFCTLEAVHAYVETIVSIERAESATTDTLILELKVA
jgi:hypothetical protein